MQKLTVLIDMDDTMTNMLQCWLSALNETHGTNVAYDDVTEWDMKKSFPTLSKEEIYAPLHQDAFCAQTEPKSGSIECIQKLMEEGFTVYVVTSSHYTDLKSKIENVLKKHFPFIPWKNVIITQNKQMIRGDILIDDGVHNLEGGAYFKILMDAPHNRSYDADGNDMLRVHNWDEAYHAVLNHANVKM